jgi:hypothetical protein
VRGSERCLSRLETRHYGHEDQRDLERAMEGFAEAREAEQSASRGNDSPSRLD